MSLDTSDSKPNEVGLKYQYFFRNLDAPLGNYLTLGFGIAYSKYDDNFRAVGEDGRDAFGNPQRRIIQYENNPVISPMLHIGLGKQTVFWNRFFYDYGVDLNLNLGYLGGLVGYSFTELDNDYGNGLSEDDLQILGKAHLQQRLFFGQLLHFRMGIGILL